MYYHFVVETLPKLALLKRAGLPEGTKILMWGESYEQKFLDILGIPQEMVVKYDPLKVYTADVLFFPTPVPRITPARESLEMTREGIGANEALPEHERDLIIYCTRRKAERRWVANEAELLATLQATFPEEKVLWLPPGGWGAPPVDETGTPLYGNVFGLARERQGQSGGAGVGGHRHRGRRGRASTRRSRTQRTSSPISTWTLRTTRWRSMTATLQAGKGFKQNYNQFIFLCLMTFCMKTAILLPLSFSSALAASIRSGSWWLVVVFEGVMKRYDCRKWSELTCPPKSVWCQDFHGRTIFEGTFNADHEGTLTFC